MNMQRDDANSAPEPSDEPKDEARRLTTAANAGEPPEGGTPPSPRAPRRAKLVAAAVAAISIIAIGVSAAFLFVPGEASVDAKGAGATAEAPAQKDAARPSTDEADEGGAEQGADTGEAPSASQDPKPPAVPEPEAPQGAAGQPPSESAEPTPPPSPAPQRDTVTVQVSIDSSAVGGPVAGSASPTFQPGATPYDALAAMGLSVNATEGPMGVYVAAIGGLAEKEHGATSGWKYSVNGNTPNVACNAYTLSDGDSVVWYYALSA